MEIGGGNFSNCFILILHSRLAGNEKPFQISSANSKLDLSNRLSIFQASSSLSVWDRKAGQVNKQSCLLSWVNSLDDGLKQTHVMHQISGENAAPIKDKSLFSCEEFCRICHCGTEDEELISPCRCSGSAKNAHRSCLLSWFELKTDKICELCLYEMNVKKTGFKPLAQVLPGVIVHCFNLFQSHCFPACLYLTVSFLL